MASIKYSFEKLLVYASIALFIGLVFGPLIFPIFLKTGMRKQLRLTPNTQARKLFEVIPFPLEYKLYLFNVTNKDEITAGGKPKLQELGPYHFEEWVTKVEIEDNSTEDTIEYDFIRTYKFRPDKSISSGEETIVVAHPMLLSLAMAIKVGRPELSTFINAAIKGLLHNPQDIFFTGRPIDLFFEGIILDCSSSSYEVSGVCAEFESGDYAAIKPINETAFSFSLIGNINGTSGGRFVALRGKKNIKDVGRVIRFNGAEKLENYAEDNCNVIRGTDGTVFAPFQDIHQPYYIFAPQICRSLRATYNRKSKYKGIKTKRFLVDLDMSNNEFNSSCYCREDGFCSPNGVHDMFACVGTPFGLSAPHFYNASTLLTENIDGLCPSQEKHEFFMDFYQFSGTPVSAFARIQLNMQIMPIAEIPYMQNLMNMYFPILWIDDGVSLGKKFTNMLKYQLILMTRLQKFITYGCSLTGICLIIAASIVYFTEDEQKSQANESEQISVDAS